MRFPVGFLVAAAFACSVSWATGENSPEAAFPESCEAELRAAALHYKLAPEALQSKFTLDVTSFTLSGNQTDPQYQLVKKQATEAAKFVAWIYKQWPVSDPEYLPFQTIEIVPWSAFGNRNAIDLSGDTLVIRMGSHAYTCDEIRAMWNEGQHLHSDLPWPLPRRSAELTIWKYANPTGLTMRSVKRGLHAARKLFGAHVKALLDRHRDNPAALRAALSGLLEPRTGREIADDLGLRLAAIGDEDLATHVEQLTQTLDNPISVVDFLSQLNFAGIAGASDIPGNVTVRMWFSVYLIGNFHWIRIKAAYGEKSVEHVASTLPPFKNLNVWIIFSFIGVYTVDVIDIQAFADKLYIASAIEAAFRAGPSTP